MAEEKSDEDLPSSGTTSEEGSVNLDLFPHLINLLASSKLDTFPPGTRNAKTQEALELITEYGEARKELGCTNLGVEAAERCRSPHARRRLVSLFSNTILSCYADDNGEKDSCKGVCRALCHLLIASQSSSLLEESWQMLDPSRQTTIAKDTFTSTVSELTDCFLAVARAAPASKNKGEYAPALSIVSSLLSVQEDAQKSKEMMELFMKRVLTGGKFAPSSELKLLTPFLSTLNHDQFDTTLAPALSLKLRANPESVFMTAEAIFSGLALNQPPNVDVTDHLNGDAKLLPSAMRQLKSSKPEMRAFASSILVSLAFLSPKIAKAGSPFETVAIAISESLLGKNPSSALTLSDQRFGAYKALSKMGDFLQQKAMEDESTFEKDDAVTGEVIDKVLNALASSMPKEKDGADATSESSKRVGFATLLKWMSIFKRIGSKTGGYDNAVAYLAKPAQDMAKPGSSSLSPEFRFRIGSLLTSSNDSLIESIIVDLFLDKKFKTGIDAVIDQAVKKHAASDIVAQIDGLSSVFLVLTNAIATSTFSSLPSSAVKVLAAGSPISTHNKSFLYCAAMTNAAAMDDIAGRILHRVIALYCKILSKESDETGEEEACGLVRLISDGSSDEGFSAAAEAMACCLANPSTSSQPSAVISSLKTVLTYSSANSKCADALIESLFYHVNVLSNKESAMVLSLNESREARETHHPINENYNKLPAVRGKCSATASHRGYDPNAVRRVSSILASAACGTGSLAKAMVLSHAGTTMRLTGRQRGALVTNTLTMLQQAVFPHMKQTDEGTVSQVLADFIALCSSSHAKNASSNDGGSDDDKSTKETDKKQGKAPGKKTGSDTGKKKDSKKASDPAKKSLEEENNVFSLTIHQAALSLITTLGGIGANFDPEVDDPEDEEIAPYAFAQKLCIQELPPRLSNSLEASLKSVELLTEKDIALYISPPGVLFQEGSDSPSATDVASKSQNAEKKRAVKSRKNKGDFGAGFEEEEWERQMKKEIAAKKQKQASKPKATKSPLDANLSPEEKKLLEKQTTERKRLNGLLDGDLPRALSAIRCLCMSDIEVGNQCLPIFSSTVISAVVSDSEAFESLDKLKVDSFETLRTLASCVYEIDETHAATLARALSICYKGDAGKKTSEGKNAAGSIPAKKEKGTLSISALPSPCASAACSIFEMEEYNDCLSGPSFAFLFPILRAALTGPRTAPGCEAALKVLNRHTPLIAGDEADASVTPLRREMASAVLELLSHDRSQTFFDPTPYDALISCYITGDDSESTSGPIVSSAELAPLLGENGALGGKNCRVGSMMTLDLIASKHPRLVRKNPLIENRIWVNCFEKNKSIRTAARKAWMTAFGSEIESTEDDAPLPAPSKLYAIPLLPLLNHNDQSIVCAAADAFANAMGMHPESVEKSVIRLCSTYIDAFPTIVDEAEPKPKAKKSIAAPVAAPKKKSTKISTGLPTKKPKKSILAGAGLKGSSTTKKKIIRPKPMPKVSSKAPAVSREMLENQFKSESSKKVDPEKDNEEKVATRLGTLSVIASLADPSTNVELDITVLKTLIGFLMAYGLSDGNEKSRGAARNAARDVVATHGSSDDAIAFLIPHFEAVLNTGKADESCLGSLSKEKVPRDVAASDRRKEGAVVALGSVALHLKGEENADKIDSTINMLIDALRTPSEGVQSSVALCLSKLMKKGRTQERIETILTDLIKECLHSESLAARRGAAYGISAVVKGSGIASLKKYEVVKQLEEACTSGHSSAKEGALFAIELLCERLGLLFEPYVIVLLPALLKAFSDSNDYVRAAAANTAGLIMSKLSAHGVKLVMPAVLKAFDEPAWRTKQASIHMLGSMSHCAPKQLASCLPKVVPKLTEAFSDTHPKVKASAEEALDEISKVIRNPEVSQISQILLKALTDPATGTLRALEALIETEFLHAIDAPSLALIVPVLHRGLRDRAATTKRYGALIAGNMCTMINDPRDFVPYLPILLPDLKIVLLDPIPDVRSISAKAFGSLTRGLGEATFPDLRPWLIETLMSEEGSSVERSGAAQGLTEVLMASGAGQVEDVMQDEILPLRSHPKASTREGVLWVLTFLPSSLGQAFTPLIDSSLPALLGGLSDESEQVRDVAMRAGRVLIRSHGKAHVDKILPSLEEGLIDEDYRIRVASLTLLGDLLSMIGGTKVVKGDGDTQEDIRQAERAQAQIALALGSETRKRVLSGLYLARSDTAAVVRQSAVQVWKTVVSVTPRTLREILDVLVGQIVTALASGNPEQTQVAGRCLGDIVHKLGDAVLPEIIPVLRDELYRGDEHTRRGVCVGLTEVIGCSSKEQINKFLDILVKAVQGALCDEDEGVRQMAASCFQSLYTVVGNRALDEVVPVLLVAMESSEGDEIARHRALNGLTGILSIRSKELLPYLIPRLLSKPVTKNHADALGSIASVTSNTIHLHFNAIIPTLMSELSLFYDEDLDEEEKEREEAIRECARVVCGSVDENGVNILVSEVANKCSSDKNGMRKESCWMFQVVIEERANLADFYEQVPIMLRELIARLNDESTLVLKANNAALKALTTHVPAEELVNHIEFIRNLIASMVSDARRRKGGVGDGEFLLPGFNMPKGLEPLLPIYQRGILYGNANIREVSAAGLGELISLTASKYLAGPFIIKMTGPLLRIVGDRNPSNVKIAIIQTLGLILTKGGPALRAFVPQFQTTFVKALSDPSRQVRTEAINALSLLMPLSTRLDPLIKELVAGSLGKGPSAATETAGAVAVQTATLEALAVVIKHGGGKAKLPISIPSALDAGKELLFHEDDGVREAAAKVIGAACTLLGKDVASDAIQELIIDNSSDISTDEKHGKVCCCHRILASEVGKEIDDELFSVMSKLVKRLMKDENSTVREAACVAVGAVIGSASDTSACVADVESTISRCMDSKESMEVHRALARGLCIAARMKPGMFISEDCLSLMDGALKLAMSGSQRVQHSFNDFLWLAFDAGQGDEGIEEYSGIANFENSRTAKTLYSKVLVRMKGVEED